MYFMHLLKVFLITFLFAQAVEIYNSNIRSTFVVIGDIDREDFSFKTRRTEIKQLSKCLQR